jgi:hypothetical protein
MTAARIMSVLACALLATAATSAAERIVLIEEFTSIG